LYKFVFVSCLSFKKCLHAFSKSSQHYSGMTGDPESAGELMDSSLSSRALTLPLVGFLVVTSAFCRCLLWIPFGHLSMLKADILNVAYDCYSRNDSSTLGLNLVVDVSVFFCPVGKLTAHSIVGIDLILRSKLHALLKVMW